MTARSVTTGRVNIPALWHICIMTFEHGDIERSAESGGMQAPPIKLVALLIVAIVAAIFFFQNGDSVSIEFLWMDVTWPERTVILISIVLGVLLDRLASFFWRRARKKKAAESTD